MKDEMIKCVRTAAGIEAKSPHPDTPTKTGGGGLVAESPAAAQMGFMIFDLRFFDFIKLKRTTTKYSISCLNQ